MPAIVHGISTGMNLSEYVCYLFELNAETKTKLSDPELIVRILKEFPHKPDILKKASVAWLKETRAKYNRGEISSKFPAPLLPSFSYVNGLACSRYGKPYDSSNLKLRIANHAKRWRKANVRRIKNTIKEKKPPRPKKRKVPKMSQIRKTYRIKLAHKKYKERLKIQKQVAEQLNLLSPYEDPRSYKPPQS